jgi:hypothetical protein
MSSEKKIYGFHSITSQIRLDPLVSKRKYLLMRQGLMAE